MGSLKQTSSEQYSVGVDQTILQSAQFIGSFVDDNAAITARNNTEKSKYQLLLAHDVFESDPTS